MVPPYRPPRPAAAPGASRRRVTAVAVGAAAVALGLLAAVGAVGWGRAVGATPAGCVDQPVASTMGGLTVRHCGEDARAWCASAPVGGPLLSRQARDACRAAGLRSASARPVP